MVTFIHSLKAKSIALLTVVLLLMLTACNGDTSNTTSTTNPTISITVGSKAGTEGQLLITMYALLLRHVGLTVVEQPAANTDDVVFNAITSGHIDLYPEFTATGLGKMGLNSTGNAQQDYLQVKQAYEAKYHITWLAASPLNDTYGICTTQAKATSLGATRISDLAKNASDLTIATPPEGITPGVKVVKAFYDFSFKTATTYNTEALTFPAVTSGTQDLNICNTTSADIVKYKFVLLQDDRSAFPTYNPAPIVRDGVLKKAPQIATILDKLAPYLTTQISQQLQSEVVNGGKSVNGVATQFLQSKGLL